ncbi:MAG: thaumatin family protein [Acidobacteriota bacterium]
MGCFWDFPPGDRVLRPGGRIEVRLENPPIETAPGSLFKWSGNVYASTGCDDDGENCDTALCPVSRGGELSVEPCPNGVGPVGPVTLAEFTLDFMRRDFYDISIIDGINVPVSMRPAERLDPEEPDPYFCQEAGAVAASETGLLGCSWSFDPTIPGFGDQSNLLTTVVAGSDRDCSDGCPAGEVCGRQLEIGSEDVSEVCGRQIAWWTANELCGHTTNGLGAPLNCATAVPGQGIQSNLYLCDGANSNSCYQENDADPTCCGCPMWHVDGKPVPVANGFRCFAFNPSWTRLAEPWSQFLKDGCPSAYTFPFDDATSTFTCTTPEPSASNPNTMDYTITFCPGGLTAF